MRAIWTTPARRQLAEAIQYIAEDNPAAAISLDEEVDKKVLLLEKFPNSGRTGRLSGTRESVIGPYILVYELRPDCLLITHFVHSAMQFPPETK